MGTKPLLSVIIPVRNAAETLKACVDSISNQSFKEIELLLVLNGCSDETASIAQELGQIDQRIRVLQSPQVGIAYALNLGIQQSRSPYIARMDADDLAPLDRLQLQYDYLEQNPEVGLVSGIVEYHSNAPNQGYAHYVDWLNSIKSIDELKNNRFLESPFAHPSVMFRKSLIEQFGSYSLDALPEDYELWLRFYAQGVIMHKLNKLVLIWNDHANRASRTHENYSSDAFDRVRLSYLADELKVKVENGKKIWIVGGGKLARKKLSKLQTLGVQVEGITDFVPRKLFGLDFILWENFIKEENRFAVSLVSNRGAAQDIEKALWKKGFFIGKDYFLAG